MELIQEHRVCSPPSVPLSMARRISRLLLFDLEMICLTLITMFSGRQTANAGKVRSCDPLYLSIMLSPVAVRYSQARYPRNSINEFIIRKLNQLVVADFRLINLCIPVCVISSDNCEISSSSIFVNLI